MSLKKFCQYHKDNIFKNKGREAETRRSKLTATLNLEVLRAKKKRQLTKTLFVDCSDNGNLVPVKLKIALNKMTEKKTGTEDVDG